jgi:hypothetical protein
MHKFLFEVGFYGMTREREREGERERKKKERILDK